MRARDDAVLLDQIERSPALALAEPVVQLQRQAERGRERLHRLDAADVRARDDAAHPERPKKLDERLGLPASTCVERAVEVVAVPVIAVSGGRVSEQDARHSRSSSGRSRDQLSTSAARSGVSQRISSTSSCGENSPSTADIFQ